MAKYEVGCESAGLGMEVADIVGCDVGIASKEMNEVKVEQAVMRVRTQTTAQQQRLVAVEQLCRATQKNEVAHGRAT